MAPCMFLGIRCRMSRMKMRNRVGDSTPPCGTPCLRVLFLLKCCFIWTFAFLLCIYCPIHLYILPATPHWCSFNFRPSFRTFSNAFSRSIHTASVCFLSWKASSICLGDIGDLVEASHWLCCQDQGPFSVLALLRHPLVPWWQTASSSLVLPCGQG